MPKIERRTFIKRTAAGGIALLGGITRAPHGPNAARAQGTTEATWPNRPVRFIVPLAPRGGLDFVARLSHDAALRSRAMTAPGLPPSRSRIRERPVHLRVEARDRRWRCSQRHEGSIPPLEHEALEARGLWRFADVFDAAGVKATVALNSLVCEHYPKAVDEMKKRGWEFMGHGTTNSESLAGLNPEREREVIRSVLKTIEQATGRKPRGWLGSGLVETYNTLDILAEEGVIYCGDWNADDQPYPMKVKTGKLFSIPYCMEINEIPLFIRKGYTGEQYYRSVIDQFETLLADSKKQPRVMGIPLHPMITGQPLRIKYLQRAIAEMQKNDAVWFATGGEIIDAYQRAHPTG